MGAQTREEMCERDPAYRERCRVAHELSSHGVPCEAICARLGVCERTARRMARSYREWLRAGPLRVETVCKACGRRFLARRRGAEYCGECAAARHAALKRESNERRRSPALCVDCGQPAERGPTGKPHKRCAACAARRQRGKVSAHRRRENLAAAARRERVHESLVLRGTVLGGYFLPGGFEAYLLARADARTGEIRRALGEGAEGGRE